MKKLFYFIKKNYFLLIFAFLIVFVSFVSFYRLFNNKQTYIYVKVKLGQGLWWAATAEPPSWLINSIKKASDSDNKLPVKVLRVQYYPYFTSGVNNQFIDQYNTYLTLKLKVTEGKNSNHYYFNRSIIAIGAPIDLELSDVQISGTVVSFSKKPINDQYIEKTIYLTKESPFLWEYEAIKAGDYYFDGENKVFQVVNKEISENGSVLTVKGKIKLKEVNNQLVFAEDKVIAPGKNINIITNHFSFNNYIVSRIE